MKNKTQTKTLLQNHINKLTMQKQIHAINILLPCLSILFIDILINRNIIIIVNHYDHHHHLHHHQHHHHRLAKAGLRPAVQARAGGIMVPVYSSSGHNLGCSQSLAQLRLDILTGDPNWPSWGSGDFSLPTWSYVSSISPLLPSSLFAKHHHQKQRDVHGDCRQ